MDEHCDGGRRTGSTYPAAFISAAALLAKQGRVSAAASANYPLIPSKEDEEKSTSRWFARYDHIFYHSAVRLLV